MQWKKQKYGAGKKFVCFLIENNDRSYYVFRAHLFLDTTQTLSN